MIGTTINERYEVSAMIGRGGLGAVYKARDSQSGNWVAVKVLESAHREEATMKRFLRGVETARLLNHENVVAPLDFGFINANTPFFVTEYCTGTLLSDLLKAHKRLPLSRMVSIGRQVCDAIEHAHYLGVIHRNLKPANIILVDREGNETAKVLDFGLSKSFFQGGPGNMKVTAVGEVVGTPEFMSPEQCKYADVDWRSDIYSMGCLLFLMLTGVPPIKGDSIYQTLLKQTTHPPASFEDACPDAEVPDSVQEVIYRALAKNRDERQQTMLQLRDELEAALNVPA